VQHAAGWKPADVELHAIAGTQMAQHFALLLLLQLHALRCVAEWDCFALGSCTLPLSSTSHDVNIAQPHNTAINRIMPVAKPLCCVRTSGLISTGHAYRYVCTHITYTIHIAKALGMFVGGTKGNCPPLLS
jgi:hypothetical protein